MAFSRGLAFKVLGGIAALAGGGIGTTYYIQHLAKEKEKKAVEELIEKTDEKSLLEKVGIKCGESGEQDLSSIADGTECTIIENEKINIKQDNTTEEGVTFQANQSGKLKIYKNSSGYNKDLKFVVDSGDIALSKEDGTTSLKLTQFEDYEITAKDSTGDKWYLSRKIREKGGKRRALELPNSKCDLLDSGDSNCTLTVEEAKKIKFQGETNGITLAAGPVTLKISKVNDTDNFGEDNYRFTFSFPQDVTINSKSIKANSKTDFKIKKAETGNTLTLEQVWDGETKFTKKAGLDCSTDSKCVISSTEPKLNVKVGTQKKKGITSFSGGKIKMEKEQPGYAQGLKFTIITADVTWTDSGSPNKLEELETYEITSEGDEYYLTKKEDKNKALEESLKLPANCKLSSPSCTISSSDLPNVSFKLGQSNKPTSSGTITLTISKGADTVDYPYGFKFTLQSTADIDFSDHYKIKANEETPFRIRKDYENGEAKITLEEAWTVNSLDKKAGLDCGTTIADGNECSVKEDEKIAFKQDSKTATEIDSLTGGKIKVYKGQAGYSGGLKFVIEDGAITNLSGEDSDSDDTNVSRLEEFETYELEYYKVTGSEESGVKPLYLSRKTKVGDELGKELGLPSSCAFPTGGSSSSSDCQSLDTSALKNINFRDKNTITTGSATLKITKLEDTKRSEYPFGYKFTFTSTNGNITVSKDTEITTSETTFKINRENGKLLLEKDWTIADLTEKVGLRCSGDEDQECCVKSSSTLNIKIGKKKIENAASLGGSGKLKLKKNQMGYGYGFKFYVDSSDITINGASNSKLLQYETYDLKVIDDKWYLDRKTKAGEVLGAKLGLPSDCEFPEDNTEKTCILDESKFSKVNISGKSTSVTSTQSIKTGSFVTLKIKRETNLNPAYQFTFELGADTEAEFTNSAGNSTIKLRKNSKTPFKAQRNESNENALKLEKIHTISDLTTNNKATFLTTCNGDESDSQQCNLSGNVNLYHSENEYWIEATGAGGQSIPFEDGHVGYEKGFRFTPTQDISLTKSTTANYSRGNGEPKLTKGSHYEVKEKNITEGNIGKKWFLVRKSRIS